MNEFPAKCLYIHTYLLIINYFALKQLVMVVIFSRALASISYSCTPLCDN